MCHGHFDMQAYLDYFEGKLFDQDYSDEKWDIKEIIYYEVNDEFPKLVPTKISTAITNVNYSIYMNQIFLLVQVH